MSCGSDYGNNIRSRTGSGPSLSPVFVNVAGGISIQDPAIDLGVAVALASSVADRPLPSGVAFVGELGLTGEIRRVSFLEQRVQEALRLGLTNVYVPAGGKPSAKSTTPAERLSDVLDTLFS